MRAALETQGVPTARVEHATRQHAFTIPFRIEPARTPAGNQWKCSCMSRRSRAQPGRWPRGSNRTRAALSIARPARRRVLVCDPHCGRPRRGQARGATGRAAQGVGRHGSAPRLDIIASRGEAGEIVVRWQAVDPHLKPSSFKLEYQSSPGAPWERVAVDSRPNAMRHTTSGEATWWPKAGSGNVTVRPPRSPTRPATRPSIRPWSKLIRKRPTRRDPRAATSPTPVPRATRRPTSPPRRIPAMRTTNGAARRRPSRATSEPSRGGSTGQPAG